MPRYGKNLETYFEEMGTKLSKASVLDLGLAILQMFESIHASGYIFNDLKPDNLLVGFQNLMSETVG
jgi:serine/threonine protein kinase